MSGASQLILQLPHREARSREDFMVSSSNALAVKAIETWRRWSNDRLALVGPARSGKSHLVHVWAHLSDARVLSTTGLCKLDLATEALRPTAVEDIDRLAGLDASARAKAETALLHLYNLLGEAGLPLLVTGTGAPASWKIDLADLRSRLLSMTVAEIGAPDDALLSSLLVKLFADRQLLVEPKVIAFIVKRMERSGQGAEDLVTALDALSLERKHAVTTALVRNATGWEA